MARCRGCGKEIIFVKTPAGKFIPCEPSKVIFSKPGGRESTRCQAKWGGYFLHDWSRRRYIGSGRRWLYSPLVNLRGGEPVQKEEGEGKPVAGNTILTGGRRMNGICEPKAKGIFVAGDYGAIAIRFKPGEEWTFQHDKDHKDRLIVCLDCRESISLTIEKFYEVFKVKESR